MINSKRFARFESLFDIRLARNCFTAAGLDFGQHFTTLVNVVCGAESIQHCLVIHRAKGKVMPKKNLVPVHFVESAMQMLRHFCVKYGAEHELPGCATHITIALREQSNFEWTPCARGFRRIIFITPEMRDEKWTAVLVFNYESFDMKLTDELNESIRRACDNRWADA